MPTTRSRPPRPTDVTAADLGISPEVEWYLRSRGIPLPTCIPKVRTPEPSAVSGAVFDPRRVDRVLTAFGILRHTQGKWAGRPLTPDGWQVAHILAPIFGWVRKNEDGEWVRIIRSAYVDVPRKNGKTTLSGGIATYLTAADGEHGGQVYAVAAAKNQARYCFDPVRAICEKSPQLKPHVTVTKDRVVHNATESYFAVVASVADLMHGANIFGAVVDELHVHKSRDLLDAIESGVGARSQPLIIIITTADDGRQATVYDERRKFIERLAKGTATDPSTYGVIFAADETDDPFVEETWAKANPGYGISPTREAMQSAANKARENPAQLSSFLRLHLGIRTKQQTRYLELGPWDRNAGLVTESSLRGRIAYGGLDLASSSDLCALAWDFPDGEGGHDTLDRIWLPERAFDALNERTHGQASVWRREGFLTVTPGEVTDYDYIRTQINRDREVFDVQEIGYDPWNSTQLVTDLLGDDAPMVTVRQGFASMSAPTKEMLRLLLEGTAERPRYRHGGNPAVRWQLDNFAVEMDAPGNVKPSKKSSGDKIDSLVARIIALSRASQYKPQARSAYEDGGLQVV